MAQDKLGISNKGVNISHVSIDNAASPFFWVLGIVGLFSYFTGIYLLFIICIAVVMVMLCYAFLFDSNKMRGEKFNLEWEKLHLGSKSDPNIIEGEVVQPEVHQKQISARARIAKLKQP